LAAFGCCLTTPPSELWKDLTKTGEGRLLEGPPWETGKGVFKGYFIGCCFDDFVTDWLRISSIRLPFNHPSHENYEKIWPRPAKVDYWENAPGRTEGGIFRRESQVTDSQVLLPIDWELAAVGCRLTTPSFRTLKRFDQDQRGSTIERASLGNWKGSFYGGISSVTDCPVLLPIDWELAAFSCRLTTPLMRTMKRFDHDQRRSTIGIIPPGRTEGGIFRRESQVTDSQVLLPIDWELAAFGCRLTTPPSELWKDLTKTSEGPPLKGPPWETGKGVFMGVFHRLPIVQFCYRLTENWQQSVAI